MRRRSISTETLSRLGDDEPIPFVTEAILTEPEVHARIVRALSKLPTDADRLAVLTSLSHLYEGLVTDRT